MSITTSNFLKKRWFTCHHRSIDVNVNIINNNININISLKIMLALRKELNDDSQSSLGRLGTVCQYQHHLQMHVCEAHLPLVRLVWPRFDPELTRGQRQGKATWQFSNKR